jgi:hypothetical protein
MSAPSYPSEDNGYLVKHVTLLRRSFRHWTGRSFLDHRMNDAEAARYLFSAPFAVASHDSAPDPLFNYANRAALSLFGMSWEEITACPSRMSAEKANQESRELLLQEVAERGFMEGYNGIRIGRHGRRFEIQDTVIWNLRDERGLPCGQAAWIKHWKWL